MKVYNLLDNKEYEVLHSNGYKYLDWGKHIYILELTNKEIDQIEYGFRYSYYQDKENDMLYTGFFTNESYLTHFDTKHPTIFDFIEGGSQ